MYPLESFFESHEQCMDFWKKCYKNEKPLLALIGEGANGKTQLAKQVKSMAPDGIFVIWNEGDGRFPYGARKVIYCSNELDEGFLNAQVGQGAWDHVVMTKKFR